MHTYYNNILIPIDGSFDTEKAFNTAIEFAKPFGTTIHLVQLARSWKFIWKSKSAFGFGRISENDLNGYVKALLNLMHWKSFIETRIRGIAVKIHIKKGFFLHSLVLEMTRKERPDLVVIASRSERNWMSIGNNISIRSLARRSGCKVLSIKTSMLGGIIDEIKTLLEPRIIQRGQFEKSRIVLNFTKTYHGILSPN